MQIENDHTIKAKWIPNKYTVTFDSQYSGLENWEYLWKEHFTTTYNETTKLNDVTLNGQSGKWEKVYLPIEAVTGRKYTMEFDFETVGYNVYGESEGLGYEFLNAVPDNSWGTTPSYGGTTGPNILQKKYLPNTQTELTTYSISAQADKNMIYFDINNATAADGKISKYKIGNFKLKEEVTYAEKLTRLPTPAQKPDYTFEGWYTEPTGGVKIESTQTMPAQDVTYYAHWTVNNYTVSFNANGGTIDTASKLVTYDSAYGELPTPEKTGYDFDGWYLNTTKITANTVVKTPNNHELTAKWTPITYTINYNYDGGAKHLNHQKQKHIQ